MLSPLKLSFRNQLIVLALLAAAPSIVVWIWLLFSEWGHAVENAQMQSLAVAERVSGDLGGVLRDYREILGEVSRRPEVQAPDPARCAEYLRSFSAVHPLITGVAVRDLSGTLICASLPTATDYILNENKPVLEKALSTGEMAVSGVIIGSVRKRPVVSIFYPIRGTAGEIRRILVISVDLFEFGDRLFANLPSGVLVTIQDKSSKIAARSFEPESWVDRASDVDLAHNATIEKNSFIRHREPNGAKSVGAFVREEISDWLIVSRIPESIVLGPALGELARAAAVGAALTALFIAALVISTNGIAQPLHHLATVARDVGRGKIARAGITGAPEVREVARQFNQMLDALDAQHEDLQAAAKKAQAFTRKLTRLEEIGSVGGFERNIETGRYELTPGSCRILDLDPLDDVGIQDYMGSDRFMTPELHAEMARAAADLNPWALDIHIETAKGEKRWLHTCGEVEVRDGRPIAQVGHICDVTVLKSAHLHEAELAAIVECSHDAIIGTSLDGTITSWNYGASKLFGFEKDEIIGQPKERIIPPHLRQAEEVYASQLANGKAVERPDTVRMAKSGKFIEVSITTSQVRDFRGKVVGLATFTRDISTLKQTQGKLERIISSTHSPIISIDGEGLITLFNEAAEEAFGWRADEAVGKPIEILLPLKDRSAHRGYVDGFAESRESSRKMARSRTVQACKKDGTSFPVEVALSRIDTADGPVMTAIIRDLSEQQKLQARLIQSERMEAIGRLASGIAHDFNNLLGVIRASTEIIRDQNNRQQETDKSTALILRACERGADLTRRLLIFSRKSNARPVSTDVISVMDDLVAVLRRTLGTHFTVELSTQGVSPFICVDATLFHTALFNLAANARDAMPTGGRLSFMISRGRGRIGEQPESDLVIITVRDTGTGMSPEVATHIFEPFFTTKEAGKGTGLGLAMVYGFVTEAKGDICVESEPNKGTAFT